MKMPSEAMQREHEWDGQVLPWLANQSLSEPETRRLREHLQACAACRRDLQIEQELVQRLATSPVVDYAPQAGLARMHERIDAAIAATALADRGWRLRARRAAWPLLCAAQAAAIAVLAILLLRQPDAPAGYRTLSTAERPSHAPAQAYLQLVFADSVTAADMRATLARVRGRIVSGPSRAGVFLVTIESPGLEAAQAAAELEAAARTLAGEPGVRYVALQAALAP